jgi:hypothetical protein
MDLSADRTARLLGVLLAALSLGTVLVDLESALGGTGAGVAEVLSGAGLALGLLLVADGWGIVARGTARCRYALSRRRP